jgi:hypothetical protein
MAPTMTRRRGPVPPETLKAVTDFLTWTTGMRGLDMSRLDDEEQRKLVTLAEKATTDAWGFDWKALGRDRKHFEALLEKAAGLDPGALQAKRDEETALRKFDEFFADDQRRWTMNLQAEKDWFRTVAGWLDSGHLWPIHVGVLTAIVAQLAAGRGFGANRIEGRRDEAVLVIDDINRWGPLGVSMEGLANWPWIFDWLVTNNFIVWEQERGPTVRIRLGPKTLKALRADKPRGRFRERLEAQKAARNGEVVQ